MVSGAAPEPSVHSFQAAPLQVGVQRVEALERRDRHKKVAPHVSHHAPDPTPINPKQCYNPASTATQEPQGTQQTCPTNSSETTPPAMDEFFLYPFTRGFLKFSFNVVCCATIILIASGYTQHHRPITFLTHSQRIRGISNDTPAPHCFALKLHSTLNQALTGREMNQQPIPLNQAPVSNQTRIDTWKLIFGPRKKCALPHRPRRQVRTPLQSNQVHPPVRHIG